jgi:glycosyltransferase involved in cell wall biosynthesis
LKEQPLVTIVIPTYNRLEFVQQAITSVIAQTYMHWELIIVDDGSDDGTAGEINSMNNIHIKVLQLKHSGNIAYLRNTGVKEGSGEWLAFLDSDDLWIPQKLEIQLNNLIREGKRWGYGGFELMNREMQPIPNKAGIYHPVSGWIAKEVLTTEASVNIGTLMLKRSLFEEAGGFNEDDVLIYREDYELVIRLALRAETLAMPDLLVRVREHKGRSTNLFEYGNDRTAAVYERFLQTNPDKELAKIARRRMAGELAEGAVKRIRARKYSEASRRLWKALLNGDPWKHLISVLRRGF